MQRIAVPFEDALDRDAMLAWFASFSVVGALPADERAGVLRRFAGILDRHGVGTEPVRRYWRAELWVTRRV